jgi:rubrerythrin
MAAQSNEQLVDGVMDAMRAEHEGFHFYSMAASNTPDEKGKEIFNQLADDERTHLEFLKSHYIALRANGKPDPNAELGPISEYRGPSPIFSDNIKTRIKDAHYEMTALSIGIQLELDAVKHYTRLSEQADDPTVKGFFKELADWERGHYEALLAQQESLKEEYWAGNDFAPF